MGARREKEGLERQCSHVSQPRHESEEDSGGLLGESSLRVVTAAHVSEALSSQRPSWAHPQPMRVTHGAPAGCQVQSKGSGPAA